MKLYLVDDHEIFRQSLALLLNQQPECDVAAHYASVSQLLETDTGADIDVILLDYHLPEENPLSILEALRARFNGVKLVFLTGARSVAVFKRIMSAPVDGVLHKNDSAETIVALLKQVGAEPMVVSPTVIRTLDELDLDLTAKEFDILSLLTQGFNPNQIAEQLCLSKRTVEKHKENIMRKADVHNLAQLMELGHRLVLPDYSI